jgi:tetratricopeptide (TPR) repeat protein
MGLFDFLKGSSDKSSAVQSFMQGIQALTSSNYQNAIQYFTASINSGGNIGGDHLEACFFNRGQAFKALRKMEEGANDFKRAIELNPHKESSYLKLAECLFETGEYGEPHEAAKVLEECTRRFPNSHAAFMNLGIAYVKSVQTDKAIQAFMAAKRLGNQDAERFIQQWC